MSEIIIPTLRLGPGRVTDHGWRKAAERFNIDVERMFWERKLAAYKGVPPIAGGSGTFANFSEQNVLNYLTGGSPAADRYFCLLTVLPDSSKTLGALPSPGTGGTVTEAAYTTYARFHMNGTTSGSGWNAAVSGGAGAASSITNKGAFTMAACTASSSVVVAWCLGDAASLAGNVWAWGSATSVTISATQTPPSIADTAISITLI